MVILMRRLFALTFLIAALCMGTAAQESDGKRSLVVNGHAGQATLMRKGGRACVDLEDLVMVANGSMLVQADLISLTIPEASAQSSASPIDSDVHSSSTMSQDFVKAGIEATAEMREWATAMAYTIQNGYGLTESWVADQRAQAGKTMKLAEATASSPAERDAFQLLNNEFSAVGTWSDKLVEAQRSMDTAKYKVSNDALRNEPLSQKIIACGHFLDRMLAEGRYQDDASCH